MSNQCCNYGMLCDDAGQAVLARMTFKDGMMQIKKWNLDGSLNEEGLAFSGCPLVPITNLIDLAVRMNTLSCVGGQLSNTFTIEVQNNLVGIDDGTIIQLNVGFNNSNYNDYEIQILDENIQIINKNTLKIIDSGLFTGFLNNILIKYVPLGTSTCLPVTVSIDPVGIYNLKPSYGTGNLAGDSKTIA